MRTIIIIGLLLSLFFKSFSQKENVKEFRDYIGDDYCDVIDSLMYVFEKDMKHLTQNQPYKYFINKTYKKILNQTDWYKKLEGFSRLRNKLVANGFFSDFYYYSKTVSFEKGVLIKKFSYYDFYSGDTVAYMDTSYIEINLSDYKYDFDSIPNPDNEIIGIQIPLNNRTITLKEFLDNKKNSLRYNYDNKIIRGISKYSKNNNIDDYIEIKKAGLLNLTLFSKGVIKSNLDYDNYFVKLIIIIELLGYSH